MAQRFSIFWITPVIGEIFSSGRATFYKNASDQTVLCENLYPILFASDPSQSTMYHFLLRRRGYYALKTTKMTYCYHSVCPEKKIISQAQYIFDITTSFCRICSKNLLNRIVRIHTIQGSTVVKLCLGTSYKFFFLLVSLGRNPIKICNPNATIILKDKTQMYPANEKLFS